MTPNVSAYAHLFGPFDYNRSPLKPLGCHVQIHNKPSKRMSWDMHSNDGFYLESSLDHYRADKCFDKVTKAVRISDTVAFQDDRITKPRLTHADLLVKAVSDLSNHLKGMSNARNKANLNDLQRLIDTTTSFTERNRSQAAAEARHLRVQNLEAKAQRVPVTEPSVLRVPQTVRQDGPASRT